VATAPAFAGSKTYGPVTVTCTESGGAATFTLEFKGFKISSPAIPHLTCPF
jgi:hypothetical protein